MNETERSLRLGLERWRQLRLHAIEERMIDIAEDHRAASEGLSIAYRNPGEVRQDIIEYLWEQLNRSALELGRLEKEHEELSGVDLPHLVVKFKHLRKEKPIWPFQSF